MVIFFRDAGAVPTQHLAFGRLFGDLHIHPAAPHEPGHAGADDQPYGPELAACQRRRLAFRRLVRPRAAHGLHPVYPGVPADGGDTLFASMYAAYEALSDRLKAYLDGLTAVHDGEHVYRGLFAATASPIGQTYPQAEHPVVRTPSVTGRRALYVNRGFTTRILGIPIDESDAILRYLYEHMENPLFQCRFRWRPNSVAFWDNRCTQHRAMWDYWPHTRAGNRVTVKGETPV